MGAGLGHGVLPLYSCGRGLQSIPMSQGPPQHSHQNPPPPPGLAQQHSLASVSYSAAAVARSVFDRLQSAVSGHQLSPRHQHQSLSLNPSTVNQQSTPPALRLPSSTPCFPLSPIDMIPDASTLRSSALSAMSCPSTSMLLHCPTPHYASLNLAAAAAAAAAAIAAAETRNQQMVLGIMSSASSAAATTSSAGIDVMSTTGTGSASSAGDAAWLLAKSSSIAELRMRAKQYIAGLDLH